MNPAVSTPANRQSITRKRSAQRRFLVAPDKFKGTLRAEQVADAICRGLNAAGAMADVSQLADGGEGTIDVIAGSHSMELSKIEVTGGLRESVGARIALLDGGKTALVECADVIGLTLVAEHKRDAVIASSYGAGELIAAAAATGAREVLVGIGGTATTDGGAGAIEALRAARLVGKRGPLAKLPRLTALCDVRASWEQAAVVFAPQKGASARDIKRLEARLTELATAMPRDPRGVLMTGSGGGLAGGLWALAGATLKSGSAYVLDRVGFNQRMTAATAVLTGEGRLDHQTLLGKAVGEVATRARQSGVPCHALVGTNAMTPFEARILDFESIDEAGTARRLTAAATRLAHRYLQAA